MTPDQQAALTQVIHAGLGPREQLRLAWQGLLATLHNTHDAIRVFTALAVIAGGDRKPGHEHCQMTLRAYNGAGEVVDNPDVAAADSPHARGMLAAARLVTCVGNHDYPTACALILAAASGDGEDAACVTHSFCDTLAAMAARTLAVKAARQQRQDLS